MKIKTELLKKALSNRSNCKGKTGTPTKESTGLGLQAVMHNAARIIKKGILIICEITKKGSLFLLKKRTLPNEDHHCTTKLSYWQL
jgi:hypothetical protein